MTVLPKPEKKIRKTGKTRKAKVSWKRNNGKLLFTNSGNIPSRFVDIGICDEGDACKPHGEILVLPGTTYGLPLKKSQKLRFVQQVGDNRKPGVIPALNE